MNDADVGPSRDRTGLAIALGLLATILAMTVVSIFWTPHDATQIDIPNRMQSPSLSFWLGTDQYGRDLLSMLMVGARSSVFLAVLAVALGAIPGISAGIMIAQSNSALASVTGRVSDIIFAFPALITALLLAAVYGPGASNVVIAIAVFNFPVFFRITSVSAAKLWSEPFVMAARIAGRNSWQIAFDHILANLSYVLIGQLAIQLSLAILAESGLAYLGIGVQPPAITWGHMLAQGQSMIFRDPYLSILPGIVIMLTTWSFYAVGDYISERMNARAR